MKVQLWLSVWYIIVLLKPWMMVHKNFTFGSELFSKEFFKSVLYWDLYVSNKTTEQNTVLKIKIQKRIPHMWCNSILHIKWFAADIRYWQIILYESKISSFLKLHNIYNNTENHSSYLSYFYFCLTMFALLCHLEFIHIFWTSEKEVWKYLCQSYLI